MRRASFCSRNAFGAVLSGLVYSRINTCKAHNGAAARKTTHEWCANSLALCQKLDRRMKSEKGIDREGELKLLLMQLAQRA